MAGVVAEVKVQEGDQVAAGAEVVVLESMKMQIPVVARQGGRVHEVRVAGPLPTQALPSQIRMLREVYARLVRAAEEELPGEGTRKAERLHERVVRDWPALSTLGPGDRTEGGAVSGERLTAALAAWSSELLREAELVVPGSAPRILGAATRDHRHALQAAGYLDDPKLERPRPVVTWHSGLLAVLGLLVLASVLLPLLG